MIFFMKIMVLVLNDFLKLRVNNMWRIKQALTNFMYGRYGADKLYWALVISWLVITLVNRFLGSVILYVLGLLLLGFAFFRFFSRNIAKRRSENLGFLKFWGSVGGWFSLLGKRIKDIGSKRYRRCKNCRAVLRLPIKRGTNSVRCPNCRKAFKVTILF